MPPFISKSKYLAGLQCEKLLWTHFNARDRIPPVDPSTQAIFDAGHAVGDYAKQLYPHGIEVPFEPGAPGSVEATVRATAELLPRRVPLFEASFLVDGAYCRVDLLVPAAGGAWDLIEVKSSTSVKDVNIHDVAFQASVLERAGVRLNRLKVMHIDTTYVRRGAIDPAGLLHAEDVTDDVAPHIDDVPDRVRRLLDITAGPEPTVPIGPHCGHPYDCALEPHCWSFLPEHPVTDLARGARKAFKLIDEEGIHRLADVPPDLLTDRQLIQQTAVRTGRPHVDAAAIRAWLDGLEFPLYCLDFETVWPAVPLYDGTRPYQHVPFQFSLHILREWGAAPEHVEYLATDARDPRPALIDGLRAIGPTGTILAFNQGFEKRRITELAEDFPAHGEFLKGLLDRFQDLATPFQRFWYYHPEQRGSCSLKSVVPALTGMSYADLAIGDGGTASLEWARVVLLDPDAGDRAGVLGDLRRYCGQDTGVMVEVLGELRRQV